VEVSLRKAEVTLRRERKRKELCDAANWLKKMEQRCAKQMKMFKKRRKQVEERYRRLLDHRTL